MADHAATAHLPACGLYRTQFPLPGKEDTVGPGALVSFHNHSSQGPPIVLLPAANTHNAWAFQDRGYLVQDVGWISTLEPLLAEGFYVLRQHLHAANQVLAANTLVQLGYNRQGDPILFPAQRIDNSLVFPSRGVRFSSRTVFAQLQAAGFTALEPPRSPPEEPPLLH